MAQFNFNSVTAKYDPTNAYALGLAAKLAYSEEPAVKAQATVWGFDKCAFLSRRDTQAFVMGNREAVIVAFRGTEPRKLKDWMTDADTALVLGPYGLMHDGFLRGFNCVKDDLTAAIEQFQNNAQSLWFTGHSLGAALAAVAVATFTQASKPVYGLYTFGQPRVGNSTFARDFDTTFKTRFFRFVNNADVVTRVPLRTMGYSHAGTFLYFDDQGRLHDDPGFWYKFLDSVEGTIQGLDRLEPEALAAHNMDRYVANLEKNLGVNPF